jgi:hypothetical protein
MARAPKTGFAVRKKTQQNHPLDMALVPSAAYLFYIGVTRDRKVTLSWEDDNE